MRKRVPLPAYVPDALPRGDVLTKAKNVYPAPEGYRAAQAFSSVSDPLPATFNGAASFVSTGGTAYLLAGTTNGLVRLANGSWSVLLTALSVSERWRFTQFGDFVVCVNGGVTQVVDLNAGTASALTGAPTATDVTVVGNHVVVAQPNGDILKVRWSAFGDHTAWTLGTNQAGEQPQLVGGEVMGVVGGEYGVILQRQRLTRMILTGDPDAPFQFDEISSNYGCASKPSIAAAGRTIFFLSDRGFIALDDGQAIREIGNEKFDRAFREQVGPDDYDKIWSAVDPTRSLVMWGVTGQPGTVWVYNWKLDRASQLEFNFDGLFSGFEDSVTLEGLEAIYPDLDAMPYSLDDDRFSGGNPRLYFVVDGEVGTLSGANLPAMLEQGEYAPAGDNLLRLRAVWPDTDAVSGITVFADARQRKGDGGFQRAATGRQDSGRMPLQHRGRFFRFGFAIDDPDWTYISGYELEASAGGVR